MTREEKKIAFMRILGRYMPREAVEWSAEFVLTHAVKMKITRVRSSKLGDYRHPFGREGHQITINHDLNPIAFLVTFVHEAAHLETWNKHKNSVSPHGREWQGEFARLIREIIELRAFPEELIHHFLSRGDSLSASSCSDKELNRLLRKYDPPRGTVLLEELPDQVHFQLSTGEVFQKGQKQRTRYKCLHVQKKKWYLVSGQAEVRPWNEIP
jgi:SprT protein